jgi:hypothetical protein
MQLARLVETSNRAASTTMAIADNDRFLRLVIVGPEHLARIERVGLRGEVSINWSDGA